MEYRDEAKIDSSQVIRSGGSGRGPGIAIGGGAGLLVMLLALFFNVDLSGLLGGTQPEQAPITQSTLKCERGVDIKQNPECRWEAYVTSIQSYWTSAMDGYQPAPTQIFSGQVSTACGVASSQVGPFYCPADKKVYLDTQFTEKLLDQLGAQGGDAAEAYILAHEYGHHISNLIGSLPKAQAYGNQTGPRSAQTRLELQADCFAGVFFANTIKDPNSVIKTLTRDDLLRIVDAAKAVGDDHIQLKSTGNITPESWTHGSSKMRQYWVAKGFQSGDPNVCDTFSTNDLGE